MVARFALPLLLALAACADAPDAEPSTKRQAVYSPRLTQAQIDRAMALLRDERKVADADLEQGPSQELWTIAVRTDGTNQRGYAEYICLVLSEAGAYDPQLTVVDLHEAEGSSSGRASTPLISLRCGSV